MFRESFLCQETDPLLRNKLIILSFAVISSTGHLWRGHQITQTHSMICQTRITTYHLFAQAGQVPQAQAGQVQVPEGLTYLL